MAFRADGVNAMSRKICSVAIIFSLALSILALTASPTITLADQNAEKKGTKAVSTVGDFNVLSIHYVNGSHSHHNVMLEGDISSPNATIYMLDDIGYDQQDLNAI